MKLKKEKVEKYTQLPDKAGVTYDVIEEFKPKSYIKLENGIINFLEYSHKTISEKQPPITAEMLVAPWGLGKTTTYDKMIKELLKDERFNGFSLKITAQEISHMFDNLSNSREFKELSNDADRFLLILSNLLLHKPEFNKIFSSLHGNSKNTEEIEQFFIRIKSKYDFFLIFIDEFEEVIKNENNIVVFILKSLKTLLNGTSNIINKETNPELNHFLSFLIACTDAAFYEIKRHEKLKYEYGGIKRRIHDRYILGITLRESIEYLYKLNKFSYSEKHVSSFTNLGASFNVIARMAMYNAGYMKSFYWELMSAATNPNDSKYITRIDGELLIETAKNFTLEYMEAARNAISEEVYLNWLKKFRRKPLISNLIYLFLGEIKAFSLQEIVKRFENGVNETEILTGIRTLNRYIKQIHSDIQKSITEVNLLKQDINSADIENVLNQTNNPVETNENGERVIKFLEGDVLLNQFLESISFFEIDDKGEIIEKFYFSTNREILQDFFPYLESETINILRIHFDSLIDKEKIEHYIINPNIFNIVFPLPIPLEYNIIKNKNINVALWTEISRTKKSEIYRDSICEIIAYFLTQKKIIHENNKSNIRNIRSFEYFKNQLDSSRFLILESYSKNTLSNNPINLMFWRELGDYDDSVINDIISNIALFQKMEQKNIHIIIVISQTKISEDLISILSENVEYSVIQQLSLSQFDITKFAFLDRVKDMNDEDYDKERFKIALEKLISPFEQIFEAVKRNIKEKGLDIKLKKLMSPLTNIPQLLKYLIYDFRNKFDNWETVELTKPFDVINPIGLSPRYSSSIDDWSQWKLKSSIKDFLQLNRFVKIENNSLTITMPKIEKKILQLLREFSKRSIYLTINTLKAYFFETTESPGLLEDVILNDLENRGIIEISSKKTITLVKRNDQLLNSNLKDLIDKIKTLHITDKNFYHLFTFKKKGFSLIFLSDFLDTLEFLLDLNIDINEEVLFSRQIVFNRIFSVFEGIFNKIFIPLDVKISNFRTSFENEKKTKFNPDYFNSKLKELGFKNIKIESFPELRKLEDISSETFNLLDDPIDKNQLREEALEYQRKHAEEVNLKGEPFAYLNLQKHKLDNQFEEPFLNLIYQKLLDKKKQVLKSNVFKELKDIKKNIEEIVNNYAIIKRYGEKSSYTGKIAPLIFEKLKNLSKFKFFETGRDVSTLDEMKTTLINLKSEINKKNVEIEFLLKRYRSDKHMNLLDKINLAEVSIESEKLDIEKIIEYLLKKKIIDKVDDIESYANIKEVLDISKYLSKINNCNNLTDLQHLANNISTVLLSRTDLFSTIMDRFRLVTVKYFKDWRNIKSLERLFESLKYTGYANTCKNYLNQLKRFYNENQDIPFINICDDVLSLQTRIEQGYQKILKKKLDEKQQEIFLELHEKFNKIGWFTEADLVSLGKKFKLNPNDITQFIQNLINKDLTERAYRFK